MNAMAQIEQQTRRKVDWRVVEMARKDGPRGLNPDSLMARLARWFGISVPQALANDELEALRRFSVRSWFCDFVPTREMGAFLAAGYSKADAKRILAYVAHHRGFTPTLLVVPA